jgi:hypothetical protein
MSEYIRSSTVCKAAKLIGALRMMQYGLRPYPGATWETLFEEAAEMTGEKYDNSWPSSTANTAINDIMNFVRRTDTTVS